MGLARRLSAPAALARARAVAVVVAILGTLPHIVNVAADPLGWRVAGIVALAVLVADFGLTFLRRRTFLLDPLLTALLVVIATRPLRDPDGVIGLCLSVLVTQSMYGTKRQAYLRLVLVVAVFPLAMALSPTASARGLLWHSPQTLGLMPFLGMMGVLNIWLRTALVGLQQAAARDSVLANAGQQLISQTDLGQVRRIAESALAGACADLPGQAVLVVHVRDGTVVVEMAVDPAARGAVLPLSAVSGVDLPADSVVRLGPDACAALGGVVGRTNAWWAARLDDARGDRYLLVSGPRPDGGLVDTVRTLVVQQSMAEARCRTHSELDRRAHYDELTGLPNRRALFERLTAARDSAPDDPLIALLLIDLDDFKAVNDGFGHAAGDWLLVEIANRITAVAGSTALAARLGGDEFALLCTDLADPEAAVQLAEDLCRRLCQPVPIPGATVHVGASIGVVTGAAAGSAADLMRYADIAMYSAKAKGKNRVERFTDEHHGQIAHQRTLEEHLAHAVDRAEISVHYQPYVDLRTGRCLGVEALARWLHPTLGPIPPATFIPLAIRSNLLSTLGQYVLDTACADSAAWRRQPGAADLSVSVNVGAAQLYDPGFVAAVHAATRRAGLPPDRLVLEITEDAQVDADRAGPTLVALTDLGVRLAIDDFGTGTSSFATLRAAPVHQLKIDRSLISGTSATGPLMLRLAVAAGHALGIDTVAEGVETEQQAAAVRAAGITAAQGDLYGRPMPADELGSWLARTNSCSASASQVSA